MGESIQYVWRSWNCLWCIGDGTIPRNRKRIVKYDICHAHKRLQEFTKELRRVKPYHRKHHMESDDETTIIG